MAQNSIQNVTTGRHAVAIFAIASLVAAISAFQYLSHRVQAGFSAMSLRQSRRRENVLADDVRDRELQRISWRSDASPRGLFDPLYSGLSADAARIDAAICRRARLR